MVVAHCLFFLLFKYKDIKTLRDQREFVIGFYLTCPASIERLILPPFVFPTPETVMRSDLRDSPMPSAVWWGGWSPVWVVLYRFACFILTFK